MSRIMYTAGGYLKKNPTWHAEDSPWKAKQIINILNKNNIHPRSIVEVGCGSGEILNQLKLNMPEDTIFTGYEISPQAFELCQKRKKKHLNFYLKDLLQEKDAFFDVVLCIDVLEHIEDYFSFLRGLKEKGEYKIFHIPLDLSVQTVLRCSPILKVWSDLGHIHCFNKEIAIEILKDTGYEILDYFYTAGSTDLPARSFKSLLARIPRKIMFKLNKDITVRILGRYSLLVLTK
ncbi:MAG: class I SAM-dependent methyltransferase [bacterium]